MGKEEKGRAIAADTAVWSMFHHGTYDTLVWVSSINLLAEPYGLPAKADPMTATSGMPRSMPSVAMTGIRIKEATV